ncbi:MFS transporter [Actinomycetospora cinnamomea]|uniref:MFS transporter n=1 Tax=Actinomycetospora cinnamomea TaxID=663609 RepID=UPI0014020126|nr:MFS transporter [Actinomycetospora cinnamomea]
MIATTVALGLATGAGPLADPLAAAHGVGRGSTASMFSATLFVMLATGLLAGPLAGRWGTRRLALAGAALLPAGLVALALTEPFALAGAAFALGVGGGAGCLFVPMLAEVGATFGRHRSVALVLATAGGGLGTVVAPPVVLALLDGVGLRGTLLLLAAGSAAVLVGCALTAGPGRAPADGPGAAEPGPLTVLRDPEVRRLCLAAVGVTAAMFVPFVHLAPDTVARGLGPAFGAALVAVVGAASVVGRLAVVPAVARWGAWPLYRAAAVTLTAVLGVWLVAGNRTVLLLVFALVFGPAHGAYVGLGTAVAAERFGTTGLAARLGVMHASAAIGGLLGPATAGWAVQLLARPGAAPVVAAVFGAAGCVLLLGRWREHAVAAPRTPAPPGAPAGQAASSSTS